jgi:hypothetical protein
MTGDFTVTDDVMAIAPTIVSVSVRRIVAGGYRSNI